MIRQLKEEGWLRTPRVIRAFERVDRGDFVPRRYRDAAYVDEPLPIGEGQTISAPSMVAVMTELLEPGPGDRVLEIGAGSGYQSAILSLLVKKVYAIELETLLVAQASERLKKVGCNNVEIIVGDGSKGHAEKAPYDKTIMACAAEEVPAALKEQLKAGGILIAPVGGPFMQILTTLKKTGKNRFEEKQHMRCSFVPLRRSPRGR